MKAAFQRNMLQLLFYKLVIFKTPQNDINQRLILYVTGGQTVDFGRFFSQSQPFFWSLSKFIFRPSAINSSSFDSIL